MSLRNDWLQKIKNSPLSLNNVPKELLEDESFFLEVVKDSFSLANKYPNKENFSYECFKKAVKQGSNIFRHVPEKYKTEELSLMAAKMDGLSIMFGCKNGKTEKVYLAAVKQNGLALEHVPHEYRTDQICEAAVKEIGHALKFIDYKPEYLKILAIKQNWRALGILNKEEQTPDLCLLAIKKNPEALSWVRITSGRDDEKMEYLIKESSFTKNKALIKETILNIKEEDL